MIISYTPSLIFTVVPQVMSRLLGRERLMFGWAMLHPHLPGGMRVCKPEQAEPDHQILSFGFCQRRTEVPVAAGPAVRRGPKGPAGTTYSTCITGIILTHSSPYRWIRSPSRRCWQCKILMAPPNDWTRRRTPAWFSIHLTIPASCVYVGHTRSS